MITDNHCTHCISNSSSEHSYKDYILHGMKNLDDVSIESLVCNKNITQFDTNIIDRILSKKRLKIQNNNKQKKENLLSVCNVESILISNKELQDQFKIENDIEYNYQSEAINNYFGEKEEKKLLVPSKEVEYSYNIKQDLLYKVERVYGTIIDRKLVINSTSNALEDLENIRYLNERNKMSKEDCNVISDKEQEIKERKEMLQNDININKAQKNEFMIQNREEMKNNDYNALEYYRMNRERINFFENDSNAITKIEVYHARREMKLNDYNVLSVNAIKQERSAMEKNDINIIVQNESIDRHSEENIVKEKELSRKDDIPSSNEVISDTFLKKTKNNISCNNESIEHSINSEMFNDTNNIEEEEKKEIKIEKVQEFEIEADIMQEENKENREDIIQQSMNEELNEKEDNVKNNEELKEEKSILNENKDLNVKENNTNIKEEEKIIDDIPKIKENEKQEKIEEINKDSNKENSNCKEKEENIPNKEEIKEDNKEVPLNNQRKTEENIVNDITIDKEKEKLEETKKIEEINKEQINEKIKIKDDEEKNILKKEEVIEDNQQQKKTEEEQKEELVNENENIENKGNQPIPLNDLKKTEEEQKDQIMNEKDTAKKEESNENVLLYNESEEFAIPKNEAPKDNSKINEQIKNEDNNLNQKKEIPIEVDIKNISNIKQPQLEVGIQADINNSKSNKSIQVSIIKEEQKNENVSTTKNKEKKSTRQSKILIDSEKKPMQELKVENSKKEVPNQFFTQDIKNEIENVENENTIEDNSLKILLNDSVPDLINKKKWNSQILNKPSVLLEKKIRFQPTTLTSQNNSLYSKNIIQNSSVLSKHSKSIKLNHIEENNDSPIQKDITQEASSNKILIEKTKIKKLLKKVNTSKTPLLQTIPVPEQESLYQLHKSGSKQKYKKHHGTIENCSICQAKLKENINKEIENNNNISNQKINHSIICAHRTKLSKPHNFKRNTNYNSFFHFDNGSVLKMKKSSSTSNMLTTGITQKQFEKNANYYKSMMQDRTNPYSIYCTEKIYGPRTSRKGRLVLSGKSTSVGKRTLGSGEWKMWNDFSTNENSMMRNDYAQYPVIYKYFHY